MKPPKKRGKGKGAPKERPQIKLQVPAMTANLQQEASIVNVAKTDNWGKASTLGRWASVLTWCWDKVSGWKFLDDWPDLLP